MTFQRRASYIPILIVISVLAAAVVPNQRPALAGKFISPFSLPFKAPPGPSTWLIGQQYGDTSTAYNLGKYWYRAGQGLHFGLDFAVPCGTPVFAIGDGIVEGVDNFAYGLLPHNVEISHPGTGYVSLYGHLSVRSPLSKGQLVWRGELVGLSGDPDGTCQSRPHLHLEIRSHSYLTAYDPAPLLRADWPMLSSIGYFAFGGFAKDLTHPNRWQTIEDQPPVSFKGDVINNFDQAWPPPTRVQPSPRTLPAFIAPSLAEGAAPTFQRLTAPGCCSQPWWSPDSKQILYFDGPSGQLASVMAVRLDGTSPDVYEGLPPTLWSANAQYRLKWDQGLTRVVHVTDNAESTLPTGAWPAFSPDNAWLMWQTLSSDEVPGQVEPSSEIWIARMGENVPELIERQIGGSACWLDNDHLLLVTRVGQTNAYDVKTYSLSSGATTPVITIDHLRGLDVAPGGRYILYYTLFQSSPDESGMYLLDRLSRQKASLLPFFGSWRWRDSNSVIYIPFEPGKPMSFMIYDVVSAQSRPLTDPAAQPFEVANDDWSISPDGRYIVFWSNDDHALWLVTLPLQS